MTLLRERTAPVSHRLGEELYLFDRGVLRWLGAALGTGVALFGAMLLA
jgi:hypothetical protein